MKNLFEYIFLAVLIIPLTGLSQQAIDARSAGMAFSNSSATMGAEYVGLNPAALALRQSYNFELNLMSLHLSAMNNSFNKKRYDQYLTTGDMLSDADIQNILNSVPASGLRVDFSGRANLFSLYTRNLSLSLTGVSDGFFNIPREVYEILLEGNSKIGHAYSFDNLAGQAWGGLAANFGLSIPVKNEDNESLNFASVGLNARYLKGMVYYEITESQGTLNNQLDEVSADAYMEMISAKGGSGFALDWGMILQFNHNLTVSFTTLNLIGTMQWQSETEKHILGYQVEDLAFNLDGFTFPEFVEDSNYVETDTSMAIGAFSTRPPMVMDLGFAYQFNPKWLLTLEYEQGFSNKMGASKTPRVAFGSEYKFISLLPVRAGMSLGGRMGSAYAFGFGLDLKYWFLDVAVINHRGLTPSSGKGLTLAATTRLRF